MGMPSSAIWLPPNHMMATVERFRMTVSVGIMSANRRLTLSVVVREVVVGDVEALLLVPRAVEGADDAHAAQHLARDLVDAVDLLLHRREERDGPAQHEADERRPSRGWRRG